MPLFANHFEPRSDSHVVLPDGTNILLMSQVAANTQPGGWENVNDDLIIDVFGLKPSFPNPAKVSAVAVVHPASFEVFDKGLVEISRSRAEPVFTPDGGLVLRLSARLVITGARLFRVGYQVIVVIAP
jgi:hypothetical protein